MTDAWLVKFQEEVKTISAINKVFLIQNLQFQSAGTEE